VLARDRRVLLFGPPGIGKSTLAAALADGLGAAGRVCRCISADPGSPAFGPPGALALGSRRGGDWQTLALEPLCTLDAGRFRLPLVGALRRLLPQAVNGTLLIDAPGVVRGVAGRELLQALVPAADLDLVLALTAEHREPPLLDELGALAALGVELHLAEAAEAARRPGRRERARARTAQWDAYLGTAVPQTLQLAQLRLLGTPPPRSEPAPWTGRQIALLRGGDAIAMGEVLSLSEDGRLSLRVPADCAGADTLVVRDAIRSADGLLETAVPYAPAPTAFLPPTQRRPSAASFGGPRPALKIGAIDAVLINGIFADPLLHLRLRHLRRSLLFDLGGDGRLSARVAHQVTDCFVTHAHMDHLAGFLWLLRSRIGELPRCRLYGPPGLAGHIRGLIDGFLWDRIGRNGPAFEIAELHDGTLHRYVIQAGLNHRREPEIISAPDGVLRDEPGFRVRATVLDHHTPVLAYAFEPDPELNVRKDRLRAAGLSPGPWLNALKGGLRRGDLEHMLQLPNGQTASIGELGRDLVLETPGRRLVYATDLADTPDNRARLIELARNAHTLFLEATFAEADKARAIAHAHLTGRACGEIAEAAGVSRLVPFHLSRRYAHDPADLFDEIRAACGRALLPDGHGPHT
jgi:ribonuclease BN (tRNA processing enzyme)